MGWHGFYKLPASDGLATSGYRYRDVRARPRQVLRYYRARLAKLRGVSYYGFERRRETTSVPLGQRAHSKRVRGTSGTAEFASVAATQQIRLKIALLDPAQIAKPPKWSAAEEADLEAVGNGKYHVEHMGGMHEALDC